MALKDWSPTAASNATVGSINWAEGQFPSTVNDSARATMADVATWFQGRPADFLAAQQATPNMTVNVHAGALFSGGGITAIAAQNTPTIVAPVTNPRIDRIVLDPTSGTMSVLTGTEAVTPSPPAITAGQVPICQIALIVGQISITD